VAPREHIFNNGIIDFALGFEHLEYFIAKQLLQIFGLRIGAFNLGRVIHDIERKCPPPDRDL
jgi:hypothetical protein